jgi:hypothetical protein
MQDADDRPFPERHRRLSAAAALVATAVNDHRDSRDE